MANRTSLQLLGKDTKKWKWFRHGRIVVSAVNLSNSGQNFTQLLNKTILICRLATVLGPILQERLRDYVFSAKVIKEQFTQNTTKAICEP